MIGSRIKQIRKERGMTISELAKRTGFARSYISSIEREIQTNPSIDFLEKVAKELEVPTAYLFHGTEEGKNILDEEWLSLINEVVDAGLSKELFREYIKTIKYMRDKKDNS